MTHEFDHHLQVDSFSTNFELVSFNFWWSTLLPWNHRLMQLFNMFGTHGWYGGNSYKVLVLIVVLNNDGILSFPLIISQLTYFLKCTCLACLLVTVVTPSMYISPCFNLTSYCQIYTDEQLGARYRNDVMDWRRNGFVQYRNCTGGKEWIPHGCMRPKRAIYAVCYNYWGCFFLALGSKMSHSLPVTHLL